jgi:hypothetical protein
VFSLYKKSSVCKRTSDCILFVPGKKLDDGKGIQGRGRLTKERIDSFQVFYGRAIRDNKGDAEAMSKATMAILKHYTALPASTQHEDCPTGTSSWCKYQADLARNDGEVKYIEIKNPLSKALYEVLLPTFKALSNIGLLSACTNCKDQNANESLHHVIWSKLPKDQNHSPAEVSFGINLAVMLFNDGHVRTMSALLDAGSIKMCLRRVCMHGFP